ncbi:MAG: tetratricopeptide repeat protein [Planctomycetota bacterium]
MVGALATGGCVAGQAPADERVQGAGRQAPTPANRADEAYLRGLELSVAGKHRLALEAFYQAVELDPLRGEAHYRAGLCYYALGEYERERAEYRKALAVSPNAVRVWRALGEACQSADDLLGARDAFLRAAELDPKALTLFNLAMIEVDLGNLERARELYQRCIQLSMDTRLTEEAKNRLLLLDTPDRDG